MAKVKDLVNTMHEVVENEEEWHLVAHVRTWCHDSTKCLLCKAEFRAFEAERRFLSVVEG